MGGNGRHRWKISFHRRSSSSSTPPKPDQDKPPTEYLCPISGSLMADPVVVSSGQTFERVSVQVCRDLGFLPVLEGGSRPDFTTVIPNLAIKTSIGRWCDSHGIEYPRPPEYGSAEKIVRASVPSSSPDLSNPQIRVSERELLAGVADNPQVLFSHAATELAHRVNHFYSSSSEESVIVTATSPPTPLPLTTRPACYSSPSSSEISELENANNSFSSLSPEEEEIVARLKSPEVHEQEPAAISLRKITRTNEESRVSLCNPRLLSSLRSLIVSRYCVVQTNALASLVNLSLEKPNKVKIVRAGFVPLLIDVLKGGSSEAQEHAAGALFSLALEDDNKMAIGVLGALQPLMHSLRSDSEPTRQDSALALYHLTLIQSNRVKLVKLGGVSSLLSMVNSGDLGSRILLILCNVASCTEGRSVMLDSNAVAILVGILRDGKAEMEAIKENCVAALFALSQGSFRFKGLAKDAGAVEVLREIEDRGSERAREKAKRILQMMKGRGDGEEENKKGLDWEEIMESGLVNRTRQLRIGGGNMNGPNSTNF
ncbi:U-box domain-containing protein 38-like [Tripterygium wilfordii]|uniref:RING-type E3 ubiquitin transferase n=1 Tax=Tripterygium wilfordii TaxID=458696 RepID=A0A7J7CL07_TRIWF|nr:U-box domain-containing protein 38-like [Tripterygium wilfordii]KAF5734734.1 U-box domain-containing protein 38-like [Tripterygium wilfordii]